MVSLWQVEVNVVGSDVVVRPILRSAGNTIGVQGDGLLTICQKSDTKKIAAADRRWKAWCDRENRERVRVFLEGEGECLSCGGKHPPDYGAPSRRVPSHHRMWSNLEAFAREV